MNHRTSKSSIPPLILVSIIVLFGLFTAITVFAAPGDLDTEFNSTGYSTMAFGSTAQYSGIAIQEDGKIVAGGYEGNYYLLARYNEDGSLDTNFDSDGYVTGQLTSTASIISDVAIQSDGDIVVVGSYNGGSNFFIARFTSDGSLDTTFSGDGYLELSLAAGIDSVAVADDDSYIIAGGEYWNGSNNDILVVRITSSGALDTTFSGDGYAYTDISSGGDTCNDTAIQEDGMIVAFGHAAISSLRDFAVVRFTTSGDLDSGFGGGDGIVTLDVGNDYARKMAIQPDGKIVITGYTTSTYYLVVARFTSAGVLDTGSFGSGSGYVTTDLISGQSDYARGLALQADGKIIVVGFSTDTSSNYYMIVARYTYGGVLDTSDFGGGNGYISTSLSSPATYAGALAVAIQPADGKIVTVGYRTSTVQDVAIARFLVASSATQAISNGSSATLKNVTITNNSGNSCSFTVTKYPVPPGGTQATIGEMPVQWDISSPCSTLNVNLAFSYTDDELANGGSIIEANLLAYKFSGGWINQCSVYSCSVNTSANTLTVSNVTSLSTWTLGDPTDGSPTSVDLKSVRGVSAPQTGMVVALVGIGIGIFGLIIFKRRSHIQS